MRNISAESLTMRKQKFYLLLNILYFKTTHEYVKNIVKKYLIQIILIIDVTIFRLFFVCFYMFLEFLLYLDVDTILTI